MSYFSEREMGEIPRESEKILEGAWEGIQALIHARIEDGSFGASYPETCTDGAGPIGTHELNVWQALRAEIPNFEERPWHGVFEEPPRTVDILDLIEFCWRCIEKPIRGDYHVYFKHHHLNFDDEAGKEEFRETINRIFRRNGLAYELTQMGRIERLAPTVLREELQSAYFCTGDMELNRMLETARRKFLDPIETTRREALEALWDAWERLKSLDGGTNKKAQITALLDATAGSSSIQFREALEKEANELTWIGNNLQIRHSETQQERLRKSEHVDYLFHRLLALIQVILRTNGGI